MLGAELSSCDRDHMAQSLKYLFSGPLRKSLPKPALEQLK